MAASQPIVPFPLVNPSTPQPAGQEPGTATFPLQLQRLLGQSCRLPTAALLADPPPPADPMVCKRGLTVSRLAALVDQTRLVHVKGPPGSGKTTLALLLVAHLVRNKNTPAAFVGDWPVGRKDSDVLIEAARAAGYPIRSRRELMATNIVFVIDDAQTSYMDDKFWGQTVKGQTHAIRGPRFCIFTSHVDCPAGSPLQHLTSDYRVSTILYRTGLSRTPALYFTREEFHEVLRLLTSRPGKEIALDARVLRHLWSLTFGHPGILQGIIDLLYRVTALPPILFLHVVGRC